MALKNFRFSPLPNPPGTYQAEYIRQFARPLELYFSKWDSGAANYASSYESNLFYGGTVRLKSYLFADLPTNPVVGDCYLVTDCSSATFHDIVTGGGTDIVPVYYDGTNWRVG